jgi:hypothetical protein
MRPAGSADLLIDLIHDSRIVAINDPHPHVADELSHGRAGGSMQHNEPDAPSLDQLVTCGSRTQGRRLLVPQ